MPLHRIRVLAVPPLKKNEHDCFRRVFSCTGRKLQKFLGAVKIFRRVPSNLFWGVQQVHEYGKGKSGISSLRFALPSLNTLKIPMKLVPIRNICRVDEFDPQLQSSTRYFKWRPLSSGFWDIKNLNFYTKSKQRSMATLEMKKSSSTETKISSEFQKMFLRYFSKT